jgi:hypothetical protein
MNPRTKELTMDSLKNSSTVNSRIKFARPTNLDGDIPSQLLKLSQKVYSKGNRAKVQKRMKKGEMNR